jgi:hypothetical protein
MLDSRESSQGAASAGSGVLQQPGVGGLRCCIRVPTVVRADDPFRRFDPLAPHDRNGDIWIVTVPPSPLVRPSFEMSPSALALARGATCHARPSGNAQARARRSASPLRPVVARGTAREPRKPRPSKATGVGTSACRAGCDLVVAFYRE